MRDFDGDAIFAKYQKLKKDLIDDYVPDINIARGDTHYAPASDVLDDRLSRVISPNLEKGKLLRTREYKKIPSNANKDLYQELVYDTEGKLHHGAFYLGDHSFIIPSVSSTYVSFYVNRSLRLDYVLRQRKEEILGYEPVIAEWCEYDEQDRLISVERFKRSENDPNGIVVNAEYYDYAGGVLSHIDRFEEYDSHPKQSMINMVTSLYPDLIFNPKVVEYDLTREADGVLVTIRKYQSKSQVYTFTKSISGKEALRMTESGILLV
ncbi:MAG: hypothetical protein K6G47_14060 [Clostridia bacterium]|nr:hypothetical protein [Clostridia bacterium]